MVICQEDARNTTGCGNGHLQDGEGEAIRIDCQARKATGHPNGLGRGNSKGKDRVKDCREHGSSWTGRNDLRGRQTPSPFLLPALLCLRQAYPSSLEITGSNAQDTASRASTFNTPAKVHNTIPTTWQDRSLAGRTSGARRYEGAHQRILRRNCRGSGFARHMQTRVIQLSRRETGRGWIASGSESPLLS